MANKVTIKRTKKNTNRVYDVSFSALTQGEIMAMKNALESYSEDSVVARDVLAYLRNGIESSNDVLD